MLGRPPQSGASEKEEVAAPIKKNAAVCDQGKAGWEVAHTVIPGTHRDPSIQGGAGRSGGNLKLKATLDSIVSSRPD